MASRREQAGLPTGKTLRCVTLRAVQSMNTPATNAEIDTAVANALGLTEAQRQVPSKSGRQTELASRVAWARSGLSLVGAANPVRRAIWDLTEEGRSLSCDEMERRRKEYFERKKRSEDTSALPSDADEDAPPDDLEDDDWRSALLHSLMQMSPSGFEHLSAALLRSAGFDEAAVSASTVRDFRGSFVGRADRGIIITTSVFTRGAKDEAGRPGANPVDLIDGEALCDLLREHSLGVRTTTRTVEDIAIDESYFQQFESNP